MPKRIRLRDLTSEEKSEIKRLAHSKTEAARLVQRASLIWQIVNDENLPATTAGMNVGLSRAMGSHWVKRFNDEGIAGLADRPRSGRPATHPEETRGKVLDLAIQKPSSLGYPFELWTLTRLKKALEEKHEIKVQPATIWRWLVAEGLTWKRQQSWFHDADKHDPEFVEKRGPSSAFT